jgi:hypothetical protein
MLPFQVSKLFSSSARVHGLAMAKPDGIKFVFHNEGVDVDPDGVDVKTCMIAWKNLKRVTAQNGMFESHVVFDVVSLAGFEDVPFVKDGQIIIDVPKRDRDKIEDFQREVSEYRAGSGQSLDDEVDNLIDDVRDMFDRRHDF